MRPNSYAARQGEDSLSTTASPRASAARREGHLPVVVMNFGGTTVDDTDGVAAVAAAIVAEHARGVAVVALVPPYARAATELVELAAAVSAAPHPRELDMLGWSSGSVAAALCAMALHGRGLRAISLDGTQAGILTDGVHTRAHVVEVRPDRLIGELRRHRIVLVCANLGVARDTEEVTTLADGGHESAAAAIAKALGAAGCAVETRTAEAA